MPDGRLGMLIIMPVPEGYDCRWYAFPASLPPGISYIPVSDLDFLYAGVYDRVTRELIRPLTEADCRATDPGTHWQGML